MKGSSSQTFFAKHRLLKILGLSAIFFVLIIGVALTLSSSISSDLGILITRLNNFAVQHHLLLEAWNILLALSITLLVGHLIRNKIKIFEEEGNKTLKAETKRVWLNLQWGVLVFYLLLYFTVRLFGK